MASKKIIAVVGATGAQGGSVVKTFLSDPKLKDHWKVRGITRDVGKDSSKALAAQGVEVVAADLNDETTLRKAMEGAHTVFAVTNYWEKMDADIEISQGKKLADAAKEAGVQHYIFSSLVNVSTLTNGKLPHVYHFDGKAKIEDYVRSIGLPATFFMPGYYMSNLPGNAFRQSPPDDAWTLAVPTPADAPFPMFDTADTGKYIKGIVLHRDEVLGAQIPAAQRYMTPTEIVDAFRKAYPNAGASARFYSVPHQAFLDIAIKGRGLPAFAAEEMLENMRLLSEGGYFGDLPLARGHALIDPDDKLNTWEEFIKHAKAFANLD